MIELNPDLEEVVRERALRRGLPVGEYLRQLIEAAEPESAAYRPVRQDASVADWGRTFRAWAAAHPTDTPLLADFELRREALYEDRE